MPEADPQEAGSILRQIAMQSTIVQELKGASDAARQVLSTFQTQQQHSQWKTLGLTLVAAIAASLLSVWLLMPKPVLPLTQNMLNTIDHGAFIETIWPKLPVKMRKSINDISQREFNRPSPLPISLSDSTTTENNES